MRNIVRNLVALLGIAVLAYASLSVGKDARSFLLLKESVDNSSLGDINEAIRLNPKSADAYKARAAEYQRVEQLTEAIRDWQRAVDLRSGDHFLWLMLGYARYQGGDLEGAAHDFTESARLAPFYAQPRWYLGHTLLQIGKFDEGFAEVRNAIASDPQYLDDAIQIANEVYSGDPASIVRVIQPQTSAARLSLAQFLIEQEHLSAALELFKSSPNEWTASDRNTLISSLLKAKKFVEAHEVWLEERVSSKGQAELSSIEDGGFERELNGPDAGFDWRVASDLKRVTTVRDSRQPESGSFSLRLDFSGVSPSDAPIVSQIVLTQPSTNYEIDFAYRTQRLVTGGLPVVVILNASDDQILAESKSLAENQPEWQHQSVVFTTHADSRAIRIVLRRAACSSSPCPAFGHAWFDNFTLKKL